MRDKLLETFLYELKHYAYDLKEKVNYDTCFAILKHELVSGSAVANHFEITLPAAHSRIRQSCEILGLEKKGIMQLRFAYIKFLEEELEIYDY